MKRISLFLLAITTVAAFSVNAQDHEDHDKNKPKVEGSGNVVTKDINVQSFDELSVSGVFNVELSQGSKEGVKIEADDNLQPYFEVKNEGSKLVISMKKDVNYNSKKKLKVYVSFKKLKSMDLKTVGNVSSEENLSFEDLNLDNKSVGSVNLTLTAKTINLNNKSVGDVKLSGKASNATIKNKSVGSISAGTFVVQTMDIDNDGIGAAVVNAEKELKVKDSFLGKVSNKGSATIKRTEKVKI
jgi:hypothetical protein